MLLSEYLAQLTAVLDRYSRTDLLVNCEISTDSRTSKIGIIKGVLTFFDGTQLHFTESALFIPQALGFRRSP